MLNRTQAAEPAVAVAQATAFATQLPEAPQPVRALSVPPQPNQYVQAPKPPAVYMPAIKDFLVTSLPVPLTALAGGAITALAGVHYASDILAATMVCATLLGVPGTFLMSKLLRNRQNDAKTVAALQVQAQLPAPTQTNDVH